MQKEAKSYKYLSFLSMFYICIIIIASLGVNKLVAFDHSYTQAGTLIFPLFFIYSDILAEVYGYKVAKKLLWSLLLCYFIFQLLCYVLVHLPHPDFWAGDSSYQFVFAHNLRIATSTIAALSVSIYLNSYLITRWKTLVKGRYFWLRSLGSSTIGELFYTVTCIYLSNVGIRPLHEIEVVIFWAYILKVAYTIILAFPATLIATWLKKAEGCDVYDNTSGFNPFARESNPYSANK